MVCATAWNVRDFKSLLDVELDFPHLTVIAGANSAGKSSILQSLLLLAQTNRASENVVLNGPLVRLGQPSDIVRTGQESTTIEFQVSSEGGDEDDSSLESWTVSASLSPDAATKSMKATSFRIVDSEGNIILEATNKHMTSVDVTLISGKFSESASVLRVSVLSGIRAKPRSYLVMSGFMPTALAVHRNRRQIQKSFLMPDIGDEVRGGELFRYVYRNTRKLFSNDSIARFLEENVKFSDPNKVSEQDYVDALKSLSVEQSNTLADIFISSRDDGEFAVIDLQKSPVFLDVSPSYIYFLASDILELSTLMEWSSFVKYLALSVAGFENLSRRIRYLGPLRDEPRVLNNSWDQRSLALPVGIRGELTAEILTTRKTDIVEYCDWTGKKLRNSLPEAVGTWANYLGIGDSVTVLDEGKLGRGVNIEVNGVVRDLTMIGVGASQLLPVLVACLGVGENSIMLVEQPELHLHPAVQSRLADFFMFARPDISLLVETHSEYLVTRIRRRVAEGFSNPLESVFLFAEQVNGNTSVRRLNLTEFGDIEEWPTGFFDEQDTESRLIVKAISRRLAGGAK